jgi:hypothetical protein
MHNTFSNFEVTSFGLHAGHNHTYVLFRKYDKTVQVHEGFYGFFVRSTGLMMVWMEIEGSHLKSC